MSERRWWKEAVIYQIYPRSFNDSDGDGIGDIKGVTEKLDYFKWLGVDALWLSPVYKSPNDDNGYDISDYYDIMDEFGTMEDMDNLIAEAKKRGIKIIMDMVFNHTSDEHPWFIESRKSKNNKYRDYYVWRDPVDGKEPNDMGSVFSGSAWQFDEKTGQYYLHVFSKKQPDLNWENEKVRKDIAKIVEFWLDKGVEGFRLDVIENIGKIPDDMIVANGPKLHDYIHELYEKGFDSLGTGKDIVTIGECWSANIDIATQYTAPENEELSMVFQFEHVSLDEQKGKAKWDTKPLDLLELKNVLFKWQLEHTKGWNTLFWDNHDLPRIVSHYGNDTTYRVESAKMFATLLHGMKGTPFIYQGEEIGMTNIKFDDISDYRDIETLNMYKERMEQGYEVEDIMKSIYIKSRDNGRTPMQWTSGKNGGFTTSNPWLGVNPNYRDINVESELADENSVLHHYKKLISLRKEEKAFVYGDFRPILVDDKEIVAYYRVYGKDKFLVICNFYGRDRIIEIADFDGTNVNVTEIISNYCDSSTELGKLKLRPYESAIYKIDSIVQ
ncbi:MAG: alpha-glucosidase [Lachnospiraceae bacterium]|nr:alpha-glucosidase [Lachnospiraceae bacterium]